MNYWPAEVTNLSEMHLPLLDWLNGLSATGAVTAKEFYGADGWVAHHNSDIWGLSNPVGDVGKGDPVWANWYMGGAWLCQHLWEHYAFTRDKKFLKEKAYPIMKGAAEFALDWLVEDKNGFLVTAPSTSPENVFKDKAGKPQTVSIATTMDMSIVWDLFTNIIDASQELGYDKQFRDTLIAKRKKLYPLQVGSKGQLQEWYKDFEELDPLHRHASHLFGLYPGRQIFPANKKFFDAAKRSLELRGDAGTGWSKGWKINWWARLLDGDHSYKLIRQLLQYVSGNSADSYSHGGTYPNLFDAHPPFQIDGNFAGTSGMAEILLQSHLDEVHLLPALPTAWRDGEITGLVARGGFTIDMQWRQNKLLNARLSASNTGECRLRSGVPFRIESLNLQSTSDGNDYVLVFNAAKGKSYCIESISF
jgi:alpha-L-fucosidase 2